jgi:hypothetical protein
MIGGAQEEDRSDSEEDDAGVDVTDVYSSRVAKVSQPEEKFTRTWPAFVPVCNSLDQEVLLRTDELGKISMVRTTKRKINHQLFVLDSGASVYCVPDASYLTELKDYSGTGHLMAANDTVIAVVALGKVNNFIDNVHVTPTLLIALLSEDSLRSKGLWVFNPPSLSTSGEFVSAYICDQEGQVIFTANQDKLVDVFAQAPGIFIDFPKLSEIPRVAMASSRMTKQQIDVKGIIDFVFYLHQALGHPGLTTMCYMADHKTMEDFPLTSTQVRKHWSECVACWKGKMHRRVPHKKILPVANTAPTPAVLQDEVPQVNTMVIGDKICSDILVPYRWQQREGSMSLLL